ncbi:hypothetical protein [Methanomethylophilus alvi]|uniref:hypothetical protein n=1 Tax=Methanomethylophilus alvi TaxID=1291540 RepID=UPI0037DD0CD0
MSGKRYISYTAEDLPKRKTFALDMLNGTIYIISTNDAEGTPDNKTIEDILEAHR